MLFFSVISNSFLFKKIHFFNNFITCRYKRILMFHLIFMLFLQLNRDFFDKPDKNYSNKINKKIENIKMKRNKNLDK